MKNKMVIGKTLDLNGLPIEGTGIDLQADGPTVRVLKNSIPSLITNPVSGEYIAVLADPVRSIK
jgi:hypothetical protein